MLKSRPQSGRSLCKLKRVRKLILYAAVMSSFAISQPRWRRTWRWVWAGLKELTQRHVTVDCVKAEIRSS
eukprot:scaffold310753_cov22-Prasinocladus_malaysianus.AAC.1